ncbi:MAG: class I SAM-dependent methyltransferase [Lysobacteraceae bacterium]
MVTKTEIDARAGMEWLPFAKPSMFRRPGYLGASAWLEHIPFAMWVVEAQRPRTVVELGTHNGASYFAFCQAVAELGLDSSCFAVDTWKGDAHAGFYGEEVHERVRAWNDAHYSAFSRLVRSTFDEALEHFSDGSVDLLHIDGLHTLEAVTHDFRSWRPKLSDRAVVLFHDINVRERGFGVYRLFEELRGQFPSFAFVHGHGLGVLGVGPEQSGDLRRLYALGEGPEAGPAAVREVFARLGRACADAFERGQAREQLAAARSRAGELEQALAAERQASAGLRRDAATSELHRQRVLDMGRIAAIERGDLLARLQEETSRADAAGDRAGHAEQAVARLGTVREELEERIAALGAQLEDRQQAVERLVEQEQQLQARLGEVGAELDAERGRFGQARRELDSERARLGRVQGELDAERARLGREQDLVRRLRGELQDRFGEVATLSARLLAAEEAVERAEGLQQRVQHRLQAIAAGTGMRWMNRLRRLLGRAAVDLGRDPRLDDVDAIRAAGALDEAWYRSTYPDVSANGADPVVHYVLYGAQEGRDPAPDFSTSGYLEANPDVRAGGVNPLAHWLVHGRAEGRAGGPGGEGA